MTVIEEHRRALRGALVAAFVLACLAASPPVLRATEAGAAQPTTLSLQVSPRKIVFGDQAALTARLVDRATGRGLRGRVVRIEGRRVDGTTWTQIATATTGAEGHARATHRPRRGFVYRAHFDGSSAHAPSSSADAELKVRPLVTVSAFPTSIPLGRTAVMEGGVAPPHPRQEVVLQRRTPDGWRELARTALTADSTFRFSVRPGSGGTHGYRVVRPRDADHAAGATARHDLRVRAFAFPITPARAASYPRDHHDYPATDIFAACGTTTLSPTAGVVDEVSRIDTWDPAVNHGATRGGLFVSIVGHDGVRYYLSHFATIVAGIAPGVRVHTGQVLGTVGRTGSARATPCHIHFGLSPPVPPCARGDWAVRRGVVWPWSYLDAWRAGTDRSPSAAVHAWRQANPHRCPG